MIGERMTQQYIQLHLSDTLIAARTRLDENPGFVAIIFDDEKRPVTVVTTDDLVKIAAPDDRPLADIAGQLPPGVVTEAALSMEDFANSPEFATFSAGARGVIVFDEGQLAGVLTEATITRYLRDEFEPVGELRGIPADTRLAGRIVNNPIIMYCVEFNHRNELAYYNRRKPPPCQVKTPHPHPIRKQR
ncbi:MAG TPA: CBS domain-containing protein [Anaerolineae bacterium]|nr:CBS domain-containing protein [Anaerolineae bacterium]